MGIIDTKKYSGALTLHYEAYFAKVGRIWRLEYGPAEKLHTDFSILEVPPNKRHSMFAYCTIGMSCDRDDNNLIELVLYSPRPDKSIVELLTFCASYHSQNLNIGQPWLKDSKCDHGFISLPYLDGKELEIFNFGLLEIHCYWYIPITEKERDYKIVNGYEALEELFDQKQLDYLNPSRECLVI